MRNCTTKLTSVSVLTASTHRNVDSTDTAAMSSGTSAMNEAKTNSSTTSAPAAPSSVSPSTLGGSLPSLLASPSLSS